MTNHTICRNIKIIIKFVIICHIFEFRVTTPGETTNPYTIPRQKTNAGFQNLRSGRMPVKHYPYPKSAGLREVSIKEVQATRRSPSWKQGLKLDFLWMASYSVQPKLHSLPFWNGFMQVSLLLSRVPKLD